MKTREVLALYKSLLKESKKFSSYNYREYAVRRIKDSFREHKNLTDEERLRELYASAFENLEIIKRQVVIGQMYTAPPLVIESDLQRQ